MEVNYVNGVLSLVKNKKVKKSIELELQSHILDKIDYYVELGYDRKQAEQKANEEMGEPEDAAIPLNTLHSKKWYQNIANWLAVVVILINLFIAYGVLTSGSTDVSYNYAQMVNSYCMHMDLVVNDFLRLFILFAVIALIYLARKKRSIFLATAVSVTLILEIIFPALQPMFYSFSAFYAVVKLFNFGYGTYFDGIFGYGATPAAMEQPLFFVSILTITALICYCVFVVIGIIRENLMKTGRNFKRTHRIIEKTIVCIMAVNFVFMAVTTAVAYVNIDTKIEQNQQRRAEAIDYVVNCNVEESMSDFKSEIQNMGYYENTVSSDINSELYADTETYDTSKNNLKLAVENSADLKAIYFTDMALGFDTALTSKNVEVSESSIEVYKNEINKKKVSSNIKTVFTTDRTDTTSLSDFMQTDLAYKAESVTKKSETKNGEKQNSVEFSCYVNNSENYYSVTLVFVNEKLAEISY